MEPILDATVEVRSYLGPDDERTRSSVAHDHPRRMR